ncbi:MAG: choice-of-anchor J domain-containing protein, partial [Muribaculaceae bacterium]|nr:choice-of-anchor J domain-containing protein [Muribaculaceae bacterium]
KEVAQLLTGKITIDGKNPTLTYWYHPLSGSTNVINTKAIAGGKETTLHSLVISEGSGVWDKVLVDLSAYIGQTIQIALEVEANLHLNTSLDNITFFNRADYDVTPIAISAPPEFNVGTPGLVNVNVENTGAKTAENFTVALYRNDVKVDSRTIESLAPMAIDTITFEQNLDVMVPELVTFHAVVEYTADENPTNNTSDKVQSTLIMPRLAWVTDLAASAANGAVNLTWSAPDANALYSQEVTDDFEAYENYSIDNIGKWTLVDLDKSVTYAINGIDYPNSSTPKAYMVFGGDREKFPHESMKAHSGSQFLACFNAASKQSDDWLISPRLNGKAQTVSFYAKTYNIADGYEHFEFLYSTGTTIETEQFVKIADSDNVPGAWTKYEYEIPSGALYFAIRCVSDKCFFMMIDDITYTPAVVDDAVLVGYNVYRNGIKLNDEPVKTTSYADNSADANAVNVVTAVYTEGESRPSNAVTLNT